MITKIDGVTEVKGVMFFKILNWKYLYGKLYNFWEANVSIFS